MKALIPMDSYGILADMHDIARANNFIGGKEHRHVLGSIQKITEPKGGRSESFINKFSQRRLPFTRILRDPSLHATSLHTTDSRS